MTPIRIALMSAFITASCALFAVASPEDTTADAVLGQVNFTSTLLNQGGATAGATTLNGCRGVLADSSGRLWIADNGNNRVLMWPDAAGFANGQAADLVLGQADLNSNQINRGNAAPAANTLAGPRTVAIDPSGRLYVADTDNKRILRFDPPFTTGMAAVQVFGQAGSFTTANQAAANAATADNLGNPDGVACDSAGNLYLADLFLKRVLRYNTPAAGAGDTTADIVIGQPNFTSADANQNLPNPAANTLFNPEGVAVDAQDNLYVADQENNRVLLFKPPITTNMNATRVFGQPGFTTGGINQGGRSATSMSTPVGVCIDPKSGNLYVADSTNNRILEFADPQNSSTATRVFGQLGDFTTNAAIKTADGLADVGGVSCDAKGNLYAGDRNNNRALRYNVAPATTTPGGNDNMQPGDNSGGATAACGVCGAGMTAMMPLILVAWGLGKRAGTRMRRTQRPKS